MRPGRQVIIAMDNQWNAAHRANVRLEQVSRDGRTPDPGDDHVLDGLPARQNLPGTQLPGRLELVGQGLDLAEHILGVDFLHRIQVV